MEVLKIERAEKKEELEELRRAGLKWGILTCLCEALDREGCKIPSEAFRNLHVARSIIETGCNRVADAEELLEKTKKILLATIKTSSSGCWKEYLEKADRGEITSEEVEKIPFMKQVVKKYEFLSYCL